MFHRAEFLIRSDGIIEKFYRGKGPNRPVAQFFDRMPWYFSVGFHWSVGRLKGRSDERQSIALPPCVAYIHVLVVIYPFNIGYDLDLASYQVAGPDHNLPLDYGNVGHDGFM